MSSESESFATYHFHILSSRIWSKTFLKWNKCYFENRNVYYESALQIILVKIKLTSSSTLQGWPLIFRRPVYWKWHEVKCLTIELRWKQRPSERVRLGIIVVRNQLSDKYGELRIGDSRLLKDCYQPINHGYMDTVITIMYVTTWL